MPYFACLTGDFGYGGQLVLNTLLPLLVVGLVYAYHVAAVAWARVSDGLEGIGLGGTGSGRAVNESGSGGGGGGGAPTAASCYRALRGVHKEALKSSFARMAWVAFLVYPIVSTKAFQAFVCIEFGEEGADGRYLRVDVSVVCGETHHRQIQAVAVFAIMVWPLNMLVLSAVLLFKARHAIKDPKSKSALKEAISFLHRDYEPRCWYWEPIAMIQKISLIGFLVAVNPGSVTQIVFGLLVTFVYLLLQVQADPYEFLTDDYLAGICTCSLVGLFLSCLVCNIDALTSTPEVSAGMYGDQRRAFSPPIYILVGSILVSLFAALVAALVLLSSQVHHARKAALRDAYQSSARRLRYVRDGRVVVLPPLESSSDAYHLFLSHVWGTGQDQMRIVATRATHTCTAPSALGARGAARATGLRVCDRSSSGCSRSSRGCESSSTWTISRTSPGWPSTCRPRSRCSSSARRATSRAATA